MIEIPIKPTMDVSSISKDFPALSGSNRGKPLIYLDSASSAHKPKAVIEALTYFYTHAYANIHRGIYALSEEASNAYEKTRATVAQFIGALHPEEIVFVSGTTEGINLVSQCLPRTPTFDREKGWQEGDEIIVSIAEHHSNLVPWHFLKKQYGIVIKTIPIFDNGELDLSQYPNLFSERTRLVAISHASNAIGTIFPIKAIVAIAHAHGVPVLVDGAQAVPHMPVNVQELDCDFYVFSGHKLYGPTGIGVLYAKKYWLEKMPPYQGGGGMIHSVKVDSSTYAPSPQKFEAGTPNIAGVMGLKEAIHYVNNLKGSSSSGMEYIYHHEQQLLQYAQKALEDIPGLKIIGKSKQKVGVISFIIDNIHPHDLGTILDYEGIAIRAGHHCAMPLMQRFKLPATVRASFGVYTQEKDIDTLVSALHTAIKVLS